MFRQPLALILPLFFSALISAFAGPSPTGFTVIGGTDVERAAIKSIVQHQLRDIDDPSQPVLVKLVTPAQMRAEIIAASSSPQSTTSGNSAVSNEDDPNAVDGLYQDDPPNITLLSGEKLPDIEMTFAHEFGHHLWNFFMNGNDHRAYNDIYARQLSAHQLITRYAGESPEEGFAEAFSYYLLQSNRLKRRDPASFSYIDALTARLTAAARATHPQNVNQPLEQPARSYHSTVSRI